MTVQNFGFFLKKKGIYEFPLYELAFWYVEHCRVCEKRTIRVRAQCVAAINNGDDGYLFQRGQRFILENYRRSDDVRDFVKIGASRTIVQCDLMLSKTWIEILRIEWNFREIRDLGID